MAKAIVSLLNGLNLKDPNAQLEITFDSEFIIVIEKSFKGFKTIVVNTFKIPLSNYLDSNVTNEAK